MFGHKVGERTGVDVAHTGAHHQAFDRGEAHRCVDTLAAVYCSDRAAVAYVAGNNAGLFGVDAQDFAHAACHVAVACAVEAVSAYTVLGIIFIGKRIQECLGGHGLVECSVEHAYLGYAGHKVIDGLDTGHVGGVVQGGYAVTFANHLLHFIVDNHALGEFFSTVYHAMAYRADFIVVLDAAFHGVSEQIEDSLDGALMVDIAQFDHGF